MTSYLLQSSIRSTEHGSLIYFLIIFQSCTSMRNFIVMQISSHFSFGTQFAFQMIHCLRWLHYSAHSSGSKTTRSYLLFLGQKWYYIDWLSHALVDLNGTFIDWIYDEWINCMDLSIGLSSGFLRRSNDWPLSDGICWIKMQIEHALNCSIGNT